MRAFFAAVATIVLAGTFALPAVAQQRLAPPAVIRISDAAGRPAIAIDANAPRNNGEFATAIRTPSDRAALRAQIESQRAREGARFAKNAGSGVAVALRRPRFLVRRLR